MPRRDQPEWLRDGPALQRNGGFVLVLKGSVVVHFVLENLLLGKQLRQGLISQRAPFQRGVGPGGKVA